MNITADSEMRAPSSQVRLAHIICITLTCRKCAALSQSFDRANSAENIGVAFEEAAAAFSFAARFSLFVFIPFCFFLSLLLR